MLRTLKRTLNSLYFAINTNQALLLDWYYNISGKNPISDATKAQIDWLVNELLNQGKLNSDKFRWYRGQKQADGSYITVVQSNLLKSDETVLLPDMGAEVQFIADKRVVAWQFAKWINEGKLAFKDRILPECFNEPITPVLPLEKGESIPRCFGSKSNYEEKKPKDVYTKRLSLI